jgi:DNA-3-methyladenine glycosylase II
MTPSLNHDNGTAQRDRQRRAALRHLRRTPGLAKIIARVGPYAPDTTCDPFIALIGSITHQQVSMSAGATIYRRLKAACPRGRLCPGGILGLGVDALRAAGLSRQKVSYVRNIADVFAARTLTAAKLHRMSDDEVIAAATEIKGVGRWTAEMLLIFCLQRPDVWPVDDFGLKKGVQRYLGLDELPAVALIKETGEPWRPYRSYATWYLWRSLENPVKPAVAH